MAKGGSGGSKGSSGGRGGKPSKGTPADKRLSDNKNKPK